MVLDADVVEHASGPPHGVDRDGGHDCSANKKQDATGLVGVVLQLIFNTRLVCLIPQLRCRQAIVSLKSISEPIISGTILFYKIVLVEQPNET